MTDRTVLLTLGRLPPCIDIARSFADLGWRVLVADPFRVHMARTSRAVAKTFRVPAPVDSPQDFLRALIDIVTTEDVTLVVPVSEETMHVVDLSDALPPSCRLFASPPALVRSLHSKRQFIEIAKRHGLSVPETASATEAQDLMMRSDFVVKPEYSCSGRGVTRHKAGDRPAVDRQSIVQQAIDGDEYSAFALADDGEVIAQVTYRAVVRHGSVAVVFERCDRPTIDDWLRQLVSALGFTGFIAIDAIVDAAGGVFAIECNPRATSGIHFLNPRELASAIIRQRTSVSLRAAASLQEFWSAWTHWFSSFGDKTERQRTMAAIRRSTDVTWRRDDPWVFLLATFSTWPIISKAIRHRTDFASVLALDIEWVGHDET